VIAVLNAPSDFAYTAAGVLLCAVGVVLGAAWQQHLARRAEPQNLPIRPTTAGTCGASGSLVPEPSITSDGHLVGLCPACGSKHVSCSIVDPHLPFGPWVIDDHEPRIDPEWGLHGGECWMNKNRTGDYGLCVCGRVDQGVF
jgi:hypothetical protein